jgi:hypothetical protein
MECFEYKLVSNTVGTVLVTLSVSAVRQCLLGRAMAQAVTRLPLTAEVRVRSRVSPCGIYGRQIGTGTGFSSSASVFSCKFYSPGAPLQGKTKEAVHLHHRVAQ